MGRNAGKRVYRFGPNSSWPAAIVLIVFLFTLIVAAPLAISMSRTRTVGDPLLTQFEQRLQADFPEVQRVRAVCRTRPVMELTIDVSDSARAAEIGARAREFAVSDEGYGVLRSSLITVRVRMRYGATLWECEGSTGMMTVTPDITGSDLQWRVTVEP